MVGRALHRAMALTTCQDPVEHARRRRPWNRALSTNALKEYQPIIARRASQLVGCLQAQVGNVDLSQWISFFSCVVSYSFKSCASLSNEVLWPGMTSWATWRKSNFTSFEGIDSQRSRRFGGGTEMLRDGDKDGMWKQLKGGLRCGVPPPPPVVFSPVNGLISSIAIIYEHVPWLSFYTRHLPNVGKDLIGFRNMGISRTAARYKQGSTTKDLFYYLVCHYICRVHRSRNSTDKLYRATKTGQRKNLRHSASCSLTGFWLSSLAQTPQLPH